MQIDTTKQQNSIQAVSEPLTTVDITVFGEPVAMERPRFTGHVYVPPKTKKHEEKIALVYKAKYGNGIFEKGAPVLVAIDFFFKIPKNDSKAKRAAKIAGEVRPTKRPDIDNVEKTVLDALLNVAYEDDSQVVELVSRKLYDVEPRTEIHIERIKRGRKLILRWWSWLTEIIGGRAED